MTLRNIVRVMRVLIVLLGMILAGQRAVAAPTIPSQLPAGVDPVSSDLAVTPDFTKPTFAGPVAITVMTDSRSVSAS